MALILPRRFTQQPQFATPLDRSVDLLQAVEYVGLGSVPSANPAGTPGIVRAGPPTSVIGGSGVAQGITTANYLQYPSVANANGWTIAGIFSISGTLNSTYGLVGMNDGGASGTEDRTLTILGAGNWFGYTANPGQVYADSGVAPAVGRYDTVIVTSDGVFLTIAVNGVEVQSAVTTTGYASYGNPLFVIAHAGGGQTNYLLMPLVVKTNAPWNQSQRARFYRNPWQLFKAPTRRIYAVPGMAVIYRRALYLQ